ncbi:unnamed protein product [Clonostachys rosea f. rosea IK726]|uniref:Uncharacterized protein n=1 Tax=Clonostachys rosea f. rosea IK726 TaxID=1349383 RepID=A0ACA9UF15_BIOOC|nr:unnamed protein product [Clonostachys rosea f. rosea IK726]
MSSKSMEMGYQPKSGGLKLPFRTKIRRAPAGTDLTGKVAIITGGNTGLGLHCARHLLSLKLFHLILAVRSPKKGEAAAAGLRADYPAATVEVWTLEMTSYSSIQDFCKRAETDLKRLDFTILNAGAVKVDFGICSTGHEEVIQINYLSTFLLAILMLPICKDKAPSGCPGRLTIVSSGTALMAKFLNRDKRPLLASFDDTTIQPWDSIERYFSSKMLGHLFFVRLIDNLNADDVIVNLVEPGMCKGSELHREVPGVAGVFLNTYKAIAGRNPADGAWTYVDAAVIKGKESHGCFLLDWEIHPFTKLVYLPEGKPIIDTLWDETMAEYEFAGARDILNTCKQKDNA